MPDDIDYGNYEHCGDCHQDLYTKSDGEDGSILVLRCHVCKEILLLGTKKDYNDNWIYWEKAKREEHSVSVPDAEVS